MKSCSVSDGLAIFKALGSPVRVQILRLIQEKEGLNIKQIAQSLKIPVTTLSPHLNLLAEAGLIEFRDEIGQYILQISGGEPDDPCLAADGVYEISWLIQLSYKRSRSCHTTGGSYRKIRKMSHTDFCTVNL